MKSAIASPSTNGGLTDGGGIGTTATTPTGLPASLGGRTTAESQPVHAPSQGFKEGGPNNITKIDEKEEPT